MGSVKFDRFVEFIKTRQLMDEAKLKRSVRQFRVFDRRIGQIGAFLGYIQPEQVNTVLMEQARNGGPFGDCAIRLKLMTPEQVKRILSLQQDDLSIFAQAVGIQRAATSVEFTSFLTEFIAANPDAMRAEEPPHFDPQIKIDDKIRSVLNRIEHIAPLPGTVERVVSMLDNPEVKLDEVAEVLRLDPGLTSTLLRVSNSAFYGLRSKIGSVKKALQILGTDKLRQLVIVAGIMQKFSSVPHDFAVKFWENAMRTAECSKAIGKYCRIAELDELFVCGLLHNVGEMVIKQFFPAQWGEIQDILVAKKNHTDAEKQVLCATHADIGGLLFHIWKLPKPTIQSSMFHHHDLHMLAHMPGLVGESFIVHMASTICGLDPEINAFNYSKALDVITAQYRPHLKYPENLDLSALMARVDASIDQLDQTYFK